MNSEQELKIRELELTRRIEHFKSVISMGELALKSGILVNGGAAIALLTFVGNSQETEKVYLVYGLLAFSIGVLLSATATFLGYLAQSHYLEQMNNKEEVTDDKKYSYLAIRVGGMSFLCFFIGIVLACGGILEANI